jgi:hypothetical protein
MLNKMIDVLVKAIVVLISLLATIWFFTTYAKPDGGRVVVYVSLFIPVAAGFAYLIIASVLRRWLFQHRVKRLYRLPLAERMEKLGIVTTVRSFERSTCVKPFLTRIFGG